MEQGLKRFPADAEEISGGVSIAVFSCPGQSGQVCTGAEGAGFIVTDNQRTDALTVSFPACLCDQLEGFAGAGI